ncbi:MAG: WG repeat-containing protein [Chitinophagales bacterium]|nr:WG repeat-containing protein [Chitinophagales bacterium]
MRKYASVFCFVLTVLPALAGDLEKAFKYLNTGDYPNALKHLREVLQEEPLNAAANYGMAKYFSFKDNKAYNLDSAHAYIVVAMKRLPINPEDKEGKRFVALGVRDYTIQALYKTINFEAFSKAERENTLEAYQHFLDVYSDTALLRQAVNLRNQKAYMRALSLRTVQALEEFIKKYPEAAEVKEAKERYEKMLYEETTADKSYLSYKNYLDKYPKGKYVEEARKNYEQALLEHYLRQNTLSGYEEFVKMYPRHPANHFIQDTIYKIVTAKGDVEAYRKFVRHYADNRNITDAWKQLYILFTARANPEDYERFRREFPDYPFAQEVERDALQANRILYPIRVNDKVGFALKNAVDTLTPVIQPVYEEAGPFSCGLAVVREKPCTDTRCEYYYITKEGRKAFDEVFNYAADFYEGLAIVGVGDCEADECKYGIIDKRGKYVLPPVYDFIDDPTEGLYVAEKDKRFGYINLKGEEEISFKYENALPFKQGVAAVQLSGNWFFIDRSGRQLFINRFADVSSFSDSLCAVTQDGANWGYIDMSGNFVIQPQYESAEDFVNGFAIVSKKEKDPKNKNFFISQRYKIDKSGKIIEKVTAPKPTPVNKKKRGR